MAADQDMEKDIIVVGKRNDDNRAVWDRHPWHPSNYGEPEGEVFISDMRPYEVHRSPGIQQKLGEKELRELGERDAKARRSAWEEQQEQAKERRRAAREASEEAPEGATFMPRGVVPVERPAEAPSHVTVQGGLDASAHPVTAIENEPGGVHNPADGDDDDDDTTTTTAGRPTVRRPSRGGGDKPER